MLLPFYTRALEPAEYGAIAVLLSIALVLAILFSFSLELAIFRTYFEHEDDPVKQRRYVDSIWRFLIAAPLLGAVVCSLVAWPFVGDRGVTPLDVALALVGTALAMAATILPLAVLRAQQRLRDYLRVTVVTAITTPLLTVLFVIVLDGGVTGWMTALLAGAAVSLAAAMHVLPWRRRSPFDAAMVRRSVRFSIPLLPHTLSHWALQLADRAVLAGLVSATALGVYSLGSNVSMALAIAVTSLNQGFMPTYARAAWRPEARADLEQVVVLQISLVVAACLAGALLVPPLLDVLAADAYGGAAELVPWIMLGYGFLGLYYVPMNGATLIAGRSRWVWTATASGAATNVVLLVWLAPRHGIEAAAIASAAGYFVLLVLIAVYAFGRPNPIPYRWSRIGPVLVLGAALYLLASLTRPSDPFFAMVTSGMWLGGLGGALVAMGVVPMASLRAKLRPSTSRS